MPRGVLAHRAERQHAGSLELSIRAQRAQIAARPQRLDEAEIATLVVAGTPRVAETCVFGAALDGEALSELPTDRELHAWRAMVTHGHRGEQDTVTPPRSTRQNLQVHCTDESPGAQPTHAR